jgi:hypothetical protein
MKLNFAPTGDGIIRSTALLCLGTFLLSATQQLLAVPPVKFAPDAYSPIFYFGNSPGVAVGDFNKDGQKDIAALTSANNLAVFLNNGPESFAAASNYALPGAPLAIAVGDLNGDGRDDIVATTRSNVCVFISQSDGTFPNWTNFSLSISNGESFGSMALGDFNGDHKLDIVLGVEGGNRVLVLLNNGDGTFGPPSSFSTGSTGSLIPLQTTVGDVNNDGKLDIVCASGGASVLLGNGNGTFAAGTLYKPQGIPISVALEDFNNDGKLDFVAVNWPEMSIGYMTGRGDGTFGSASTNRTGVYPRLIAAGDFNGDGNMDAVVAHNNNSNYLLNKGVYLGRGDGTFLSEITFEGPYSPTGIVATDLNGDGAPDVVVAGQGGIFVFYNLTLPSIQTQVKGGQLVLSWPTWTGYQLESTADLMATNSWTFVTNTPTTVNHQNFLTNSMVETSRFFRLVHP